MAKNRYDAIVVGSGPGGATIAKELAEKGKKILILEWGSNAPIKGTLLQCAMNAGIPGKSFLVANKHLLGIARGVCTGGSSVFYCATAVEPPYEMFESHGINIKNEIKDIRKEIPTAVLNDNLMGPGAKRIMESACELGYEWKKLNKFIYQDKCRTDCFKCTYGCPYGAKWTARNFIDRALEKDAVLISKAKVKKVIINEKTAVGVEYIKNFKHRKVFAEKIIIAAGGIGSHVILKESGIKNTGVDFFYDPLIMVFGKTDDLNLHGEIQMAGGIHMEEDGYTITDFNFTAPLAVVNTALNLKAHKAVFRDKTLMIMIKIKDELGGKLTPDGGVRKNLKKRDLDKFSMGYEHAKIILDNAGAKDIYSGWTFAVHPGGTVKIGEIINSDLKTEYDNLYVCDCSVIPKAWGLPPTLSLLALGKRLSNHLFN